MGRGDTTAPIPRGHDRDGRSQVEYPASPPLAPFSRKRAAKSRYHSMRIPPRGGQITGDEESDQFLGLADRELTESMSMSVPSMPPKNGATFTTIGGTHKRTDHRIELDFDSWQHLKPEEYSYWGSKGNLRQGGSSSGGFGAAPFVIILGVAIVFIIAACTKSSRGGSPSRHRGGGSSGYFGGDYDGCGYYGDGDGGVAGGGGGGCGDGGGGGGGGC